MLHLGLFFLGGFEVTLNTEQVTGFGADKVRALLAFLAIESARPHRREKLAAMFWPDLSEKKAAHNLSQSLLRLRKALGEKKNSPALSYLLATVQHVQFNAHSHYRLDVLRFQELLTRHDQHQHPEESTCSVCAQWLLQATDLYRGDLLAGLFVPDSVTFEEWRLILQEELHQQALTALYWLAVYHEQRGELEQVARYARRQIALEPWREEAHMQLMRALAQSGQTAAALQQYEQYRRTLDEELGIMPSAGVTSYYERIRSGDVVQRAGGPATTGEAVWLSSEGEHRQVTVLACSPVLQGEAEDMGAHILFCEQHCQGIYHRFGGQRAPRRGETCLVYFGFPRAYEDAPRRAVHSGLAVTAASEGQEAVQIGIHTGMVTVGQKRGPRWQDRDLIGKTFEFARHSQRQARPGEVVITEDTRRLVQESFDLQPLAVSMEGVAEKPLQLYRVRGEGDLQSRLAWLAQTQRLTTLIGRSEELVQLQSCRDRVLQGAGQAVFLRGEPGIGKSRLVWELEQRTTNIGRPSGDRPDSHQAVLWLSIHCLPHYQNTSLYPMIGLLEQLLSFQATDSIAERQEKLTGMLARNRLNDPATGWLLALLLGLPAGAPAPETITKAQREQMRQAFLALLQIRAAKQPVVLVIEDLQWGDPSTVEWLDLSLDSLVQMPCLTLLPARPEFNPAGLAHEELRPDGLLLRNLAPLPLELTKQMVSSLVEDGLLDEAVKRDIVAKTDGNPLFVEELTKTLIEHAAYRPDAGSLVKIPANLLDSLVARLDRLGAARETAQWAAVQGREFSYSLLRACAAYDEERLQNDLARLIETELVSPVHDAQQNGAAQYTFRHALMQEAAYHSLLKQTRQVFHRRTAETMETQFPQLTETRPEILAEHYASGGLPTQAVDYWLKAGEKATAQGATLEARTFFERALAGIAPEDHERRWRTFMGREKVFNLREERAAQYEDIMALLELAETLDDDTRRAEAFMRQGMYALRRKDFALMLPAVEAAIQAAARAGDRQLEVHGLASKVTGLTYVGNWEEAKKTAEETLEKLSSIADDVFQGYIHGDLAFYYSRIGDSSRALQLMMQGVEAARRAGNRQKQSRIGLNVGFVNVQLGRWAEARAAFEEGLALAEAIGDLALQTSHRYNLSYAIWCSGKKELAQQVGEQALAEFKSTGHNTLGHACCLAYLGIFQEEILDLTTAAAYLTEARSMYASIGVKSYRMEAQATEARCLLALGQREEAQQLATEVWAYVREHGTGGMDFPSRVYVCLADVFTAIEMPGASVHEVVKRGYRELVQRAEKISDAGWRQSFLENLVENKNIVKRWKKMGKGDPLSEPQGLGVNSR